MKAYRNRPDETARAMDGGWLHTGDVARMDNEGYFAIVDRLKDRINTAGFKIWPREVEFRDDLPITATGKVLRRLLRDESN